MVQDNVLYHFQVTMNPTPGACVPGFNELTRALSSAGLTHKRRVLLFLVPALIGKDYKWQIWQRGGKKAKALSKKVQACEQWVASVNKASL